MTITETTTPWYDQLADTCIAELGLTARIQCLNAWASHWTVHDTVTGLTPDQLYELARAASDLNGNQADPRVVNGLSVPVALSSLGYYLDNYPPDLMMQAIAAASLLIVIWHKLPAPMA